MSDTDEPTEKKPAMPRPWHKPWVTVFLALVIFLTGLAAGAGLTVIAIINRVQFAIHHPKETGQRVARRLKRVLDLDDAQAEKVSTIVAEQQEKLLAIRRDVQPRVVGEIDETYRRISEVLNAKQKQEWERTFTRLKTKWVPKLPPKTE